MSIYCGYTCASCFRDGNVNLVIKMVMHAKDQRVHRFYSTLCVYLIASSPACADGGISALGYVLNVFLLFIGALGLFIILLMCIIITSQKDKPGTSIGTRIGIGIAIAYLFLAAFFFATSSQSPFWLVPAFTGGGTFALLLVYMFRLKSEPRE